MVKRTVSAMTILLSAAALTCLAPRTTSAAPPVLPNNPIPPSYYGFNPGYYGPYYPGQYQSGNVKPGIYNNYSPSTSQTYQRSFGTSGSVPGAYILQPYGTSSTLGSSLRPYEPPISSYGYQPLFSPSVSETSTANRMPVQAEVHLPSSNAELWVEGRKTTSTGTWRRFVSPPLVADDRYVYEFRARWLDNGQEVLRTRKVPVRAGQRITVDFTAPTGEANTGETKTVPARTTDSRAAHD